MLMQLGVDIIFLMQKFPEIWKFLTNFQIHQKSAQNKIIPRKMKKEKNSPQLAIYFCNYLDRAALKAAHLHSFQSYVFYLKKICKVLYWKIYLKANAR